jgi:hypothetical protein
MKAHAKPLVTAFAALPGDESAAMPAARFRALMQHILKLPASTSTTPAAAQHGRRVAPKVREIHRPSSATTPMCEDK